MKALYPHIQNKKHVIWDWNGTLLSDIDHAVATTNRLLSEENLPPITVESYKEIFRFPVIEYYREIGLGVEPVKFLELCERFNHYFQAGITNCSLWPGAVETLALVRSSGKTQSILSASYQELLGKQVKILGVEEYFHHVAGLGDKSAGSKIDRGRELMKTVGIPPKDTVMIGDTDHDLEVAQALGIEIILVEHGHQHPKRLRAAHHNVIKVI